MRTRLDAAAWAALGFLAAVCLERRAPAASAGPDAILMAKELRIVGADGESIVAILGASVDGGMLEVRDAKGSKSLTVAGHAQGGRLAVHVPGGARCAYLGCAEGTATGILMLGRTGVANRVEMGCGKDGGYVSLLNEAGKSAAFAGVAEGGTGVVEANDSNGTALAHVAVGDGGGEIDVRTREGKVAAALAIPRDGEGGLLRISTRKSEPAVEIGVSDFGGVVTALGTRRSSIALASLKAYDTGGQVLVYRAEGPLGGSFAAFNDGGQATFLNREGNPIVQVQGGMNGGQVDVRTRAGKDAVRLGVAPAGGLVTTTDAKGKAVTLPPGK